MLKALRLLLAIGSLVFPLGCAGLIVRDTDSLGIKTSKIATRGALGVVTLSLSEFYLMKDVKRHDQQRQFHEYLDKNVGKLTLDQAVVQWGAPAPPYDGDQLLVAQWSNDSTSQMWVPEGKGWIARPVENGWRLRLSFDKTSHLLSTWQYSEW